ncbi:neural cell adhesion molecule L1-like protein isoform X2 [Thalassophryne amazonica]|uniref:neural cell adhesion molecule L1-like protein isoform X2 n=1 Tax=Thalassophryne amazonica TaxID=390379 RepID=UPI001470A258|nr:neural cell adhesion molecule L1-like protein isoform X2 [Thalassophryne amazonica]
MRSLGSLHLALLLALTSVAADLNIPMEVEQLPTITTQTTSPVIVNPLDNTITIQCEAKGNPPPEYRWMKDGLSFTPPDLTTMKTNNKSGTFILHQKDFSHFEGKYRCFASNRLGTAMTKEINLIAHGMPRFPKEIIEPIVVEEGQPIILRCDPPSGFPPHQIYWMTIGLQQIEQDDRVSMGTDGNLYFSHALQSDSRKDYCCFVEFTRIRTIVQKTPTAIVVKALADPPARKPSLLLPPGVQTEKVLLKGQTLELECFPEGLPTPKVEWMKMGGEMPRRAELHNFGKMLSISTAEENDEGKYMCKAKNSAGVVVHYFDVIVEEPPEWLTGPPPSQLSAVGSDVHIKCSVTGNPTPEIIWRRNSEIFKDDPLNERRVLDDTVVLQNAMPDDTAIYQCEASNRHGSILANVNVMILNLAPLILTRDFQEYAVVRGGNITVNCQVFSSPPSNISWAKAETPETIEGERFIFLPNGSFQIIGAEKNDSTDYVCVAVNSEGKAAITVALRVKEPTKIVDSPKDVQVISGTTAQLTCRAEYDKSLQDTFEVVWLKNGNENLLSAKGNSRYTVESGTLQIMTVNQSDQGTYTCVARTSLDEDNTTAFLTVLDVPDAPQNVIITQLETEWSIQLSWEPGSDHNSSVTEFIVEYEESQWEPGRWKMLQKVPGNQATARLALHGHLNYQFRVYAVNAVGPGPPSEPTYTYKTPPAAPDRNPENIQIQGPMPHQMDISWEPLLPVEHNGPGLEYQVSYRILGLEDVWKQHLVKRHSFSVKNTSTFVPYEVKIQSRNSYGWGPEPKIVTGYSGEDVPTAAPQNVAVEVINTTVLRVSWTQVPLASVRGHLGGHNVHWSRRRSLLNPSKTLDERHSLTFPGKRSHIVIPGLKSFSEYRLTVNVFNKKGNGPGSDPVIFSTPEGVPEQLPILTASNAQKDSILLVWGPPLQANGMLTGYLLQYHLINQTTLEVVDSQEMNISGADTTQWQLQGLEEGSRYLFQLSACTRAGCGPPVAEESTTIRLEVPALLNISSYVSDTFAKISWTAREEQQDSQLYVAYMNNRDGNWRFSEAVNTSQSFHIIDGLKPGMVYTVRLMAKSLLDNASIFEDIIQTQVKGIASRQNNISTQGWLIGTMCAVALLTLIALIACFLRRNKGGKYAVKEKEDLHPDVESQEMNDDTFCEYSSDSDEKPLRGSSLCSLDDGDINADSLSGDSLVDYADGAGEFNEDGSFIGEYSGQNYRGSITEPSGPNPVTA